jgi:hypothetical protein
MLSQVEIYTAPSREAQPGTPEFMRFFNGRKAMYLGRDGEFYVEPFSAAAK